MGDFERKFWKFVELFQGSSADSYLSEISTGLQNTVKIAVIGLLIGIVIGTLIATVRVLPKYRRLPRILNGICSVYVSFFRGTPMVVQLLLFYYVALPLMDVNLPSVTVSCIVFGLNSGAYVSEIMRSGIQSVDPGQMEGGRSVGLSFATTMRRIVIPQAIKNILPTLGNEFIVLLKETSVSGYIALQDLTKGGDIIRSRTYDAFFPLIAVALIYLVMVMIFTKLVSMLERRLKQSER